VIWLQKQRHDVALSQEYQGVLRFSEGWKRVTVSSMKKQSSTTSIPTLRDAYKVSGFRVRARIDSDDELKHPAYVLTLDRRTKKQSAVDVGKGVAIFMVPAGDACVISVAGIEKSTSTFPCAV
jgi:hypothetical protein